MSLLHAANMQERLNDEVQQHGRLAELLILAEGMQRHPARKARENQADAPMAALLYLRNPQ